jgi:hypothetical protein
VVSETVMEMTEIAEIGKPFVERFKGKRKLYLIPLIHPKEGLPMEYGEKFEKYWSEVKEHLSKLEMKMGKPKRVYHEGVFSSGENGIKAIEKLNPKSYEIVKKVYEWGAELEALEDKASFEESTDWQKCLWLDLVSEKAKEIVFKFYSEAMKKRYNHIAEKIDKTLCSDEIGLLFIGEGHLINLPQDIQVFHITPPSLDEIHRWVRDWLKSRK